MENPFKLKRVGDLVSLRPLLESDREGLFAVASDPLIWSLHPQKERYQRPVFDKYFNTLLTFPGPLLVTDTQSGRIIGSSSYYEYIPHDRSVSIGYTFIAREHWGHTYNKELKKLMLSHAFCFVDTVFFHIGDQNFRSQAAIKKIGAVECGEEIRLAPDGTPIRALIYKLTTQVPGVLF